MRWCYIFAILCVCVLENAHARQNIISYGIAKLNQRRVGSVDVTTVPNVSLEKCLEACTSRQNCKGINFSKRQRFCEMLSYDNATLTMHEQKLSYVSIDRNDLEEEPTSQGNCSSCTNGVCDPTNDTCQVKECGPVRIANGQISGNMRTIGSKVKVSCTGNHLLTTGIGTLVCQSDGVWSSSPSCAWDCGEPQDGGRNAILSSGSTYNGTIRTYSCNEGFYISKRRTETQGNITCHYGGKWDRRPRCATDCAEPVNASDVYASQRVHYGQWFQDLDLVHYTCMPNHVILITTYGFRNGVRYYGGHFIDTTNHVIKCDGYAPKWSNDRFMCMKDCSNRPNTTNVEFINHYRSGDNTRAMHVCKDGYAVFDGSTLHAIHYFNSICDVEPDGIWTKNTWTCQKNCSMFPNTANVQNLTYTSEDDNITTATFVCQDGYTVYDDSTKLDIEMFNTECSEPNGTWTNNAWSCQKDCNNSPITTNVQNITYTFDNNVTTGTYVCKDGYTVYNESTRLALEEFNTECNDANGTWTYNTLICQRDCNHSPPTTNVQTMTYTHDETVTTGTFVCKDGYSVYDNSTRLGLAMFNTDCNEVNGTWTNNTWSCQKDCNNSPLTTNVQSMTYTYDEAVTTGTFVCKDGHTVYDGPTMLAIEIFKTDCSEANGIWTNNTWSCQKDCNNSPPTTNVQTITYTYDETGTTGTFVCKNGYTVYDDSTRLAINMFNTECSEVNGTWTNNTRSCQKDCLNGPNTTNAQGVNYALTEDNVTAIVTCSEGHTVFNDSISLNITMFYTVCKEPGGTWTNDSLSCQLGPSLGNGSPTGSGSTTGGSGSSDSSEEENSR